MKIYNGEGMILGRLAAIAAKEALLGEEVKVVNCEKVIISGKRSNEDFKSSPEDSQKEYLRQELLWTNFSRTILLPHKIQIDKVEKIQEHGRLIIKLLKTDNSPPNS